MALKIIFLLSVICIMDVWLVEAAGDESSPEIQLAHGGRVRGKTLKSRDGQEFLAFRGIPYAVAERFQRPKPSLPWEGILNATAFGSPCAQTGWITNAPRGTEDCLRLNVYSRNAKGNSSVLVYLYAGGFTIGTSNSFGAEYFMDEDVVLVTFNYRLGAIGFLSTLDSVLPGNYGLHDQQMALQWVREHIARFGGNPESVTIFGNSAGASSVHYHILSPRSKGLFHSAILQSGSALNPWARSRYPTDMARKYAEAAGCPTRSSSIIYECLKGKTTLELQQAQATLVQWGYDPFSPFGPVIEQDSTDEQAFITEDPLLSMETGKFNKVPIIAGVNENEGSVMHAAFILQNPYLLSDLNSHWKTVFPVTFQYDGVYTNFTPSQMAKISEGIRSYYFGNETVGEGLRQNLTDAFSDRLFLNGVRTAVLCMAKHTPVYNYMFAHNRGDYSINAFFGIKGIFGVTHGEDVSFLFANSYGVAPEFQKGSAGEAVSKALVKLWASFASNKTPSAVWGKEKEWMSVSADEAWKREPLRYFRLDTETSVIDEPFTRRLEFWDRLLIDARKYRIFSNYSPSLNCNPYSINDLSFSAPCWR